MKKQLFLPAVCMVLLAVCLTMLSCSNNESKVDFSLYGTALSVHFDASKCGKLKNLTDSTVVEYIDKLTTTAKGTIDECLQIKKDLNLCDWAYFLMLDSLTTQAMGKSNESLVTLAALMRGSDYDVRLFRTSQDSLFLMYWTDAFVYRKTFFNLDGKKYFLYDDSISSNETCKFIKMEAKGNPIDFRYQGDMKLSENLSAPRTIKSIKDSTFTFIVQVNKNLVDFYGNMPSVTYDDNFIIRWTTIAEYPLENHLQQTLIKEMKEKLAGKDQKEQVQQILWWMHGRTDLDPKNPEQDAFLFAYDDNIWGADHAFFAEETLFYPYCDAEDRSILFSRLVRDVVGLDVALVYYPNHLAAAVCFNEPVEGASYEIDGRKFVVCDPTYLGASIGMEMPGMKHYEAMVRILKR